jgi:hypothetical protein
LLVIVATQVRLVVKHVSNEELKDIPAAADDLFIIGGKGAFEKRQQDQQQKQVRSALRGNAAFVCTFWIVFDRERYCAVVLYVGRGRTYVGDEAFM